MARFVTLALLAALAVAEVGAVILLVESVGGPVALLVLFLDVVVGLAVIRWGARSQPPVRGWRIAAGCFIALPGLVLDLVGLALLVPAIQRWLSGHVLRQTEAALRRGGVSVVTVTDASGVPRTTMVPGDVVPGEVVDVGPADVDPAGADPAPGRADSTTDQAGDEPEPGPKVIRGEILGPED